MARPRKDPSERKETINFRVEKKYIDFVKRHHESVGKFAESAFKEKILKDKKET